MISFLKSLFSGHRCVEHPDSFAMTREGLYRGMLKAIKLQQSQGKSVWLVSHFPSVFSECQLMLEKNGISYQIMDREITADWLQEHAIDAANDVFLGLSDMLEPPDESCDPPDGDNVFRGRIALMVTERHPYRPRDNRLMAFARSFPAIVEIGYYVAFEDAVVKQRIPESTMQVLKAFGFDDNALISSLVVSSRIQKRIQKESAAVDVLEETDSAEEWYQIHEREVGG